MGSLRTCSFVPVGPPVSTGRGGMAAIAAAATVVGARHQLRRRLLPTSGSGTWPSGGLPVGLFVVTGPSYRGRRRPGGRRSWATARRAAVHYASAADAGEAAAMAARLGLPLAPSPGTPPAPPRAAGAAGPPKLLRAEGRWALRVPGLGPGGGPLDFRLELGQELPSRQRQRLMQPPQAHPLFTALGRPGRGLRVVDATGGFGSDALLMAECFGLHVTVIERHPLVFTLLEDAARRAAVAPAASVFGGQVLLGEAAELLSRLASGLGSAGGPADFVYLDPMFPRERARRARPELAMQVLGAVCASDLPAADSDAKDRIGAEQRLLEAARRCARRCVVVKRARSSAYLAGVCPSRKQAGKTNRFDIYSPI